MTSPGYVNYPNPSPSLACPLRLISGLAVISLSDHFKSGQRLSLQNRPTEGARNVTVLPCYRLLMQVNLF
jgi:hypothetical protein